MTTPQFHTILPLQDYDLDGTLNSGQAFRWRWRNGGWEGVIGMRWVRLIPSMDSLRAETAEPQRNWEWLKKYLQCDVRLADVLATFPQDSPMQAAIHSCRGLRLLRQDPWECLASFILSSTKQIIQIRQIVHLVCERFGPPVMVPPGQAAAFSFPEPARLAPLDELALRNCKMGFRAPYLLGAARMLVDGDVDLTRLTEVSCIEARAELMRLPGVGPKIADCVLLFAYGFQEAFPVDVWVRKALQQLYFPRRRISPGRMEKFVATHFGPHAGYAQQYLFHYMRVRARQPERKSAGGTLNETREPA